MLLTKETACTSCDHKKVCKLSEEFINAQKAVDDVTVHIGDMSMKRLRDFDYIENVSLKCRHWKLESQGGGIR